MTCSILWIDDEIDFLKVHILFLKSKGYSVETVSNGLDALEKIRTNVYDIIFLDENMPGISGLDTLKEIREINSDVPVVMITKNEGEEIMDEAVGNKISDFLIKPVNPNQIILSIKKNVDNRRLVSIKTTEDYRTEFQRLGSEIFQVSNIEEWKTLYKKLVMWEFKLQDLDRQDNALFEVFNYQREEANKEFCKYVEKKYVKWLDSSRENRPLMQHDVFKEVILPLLDSNQKVFWIVIDNLRFDQWKVLQPLVAEYFTVEKEDMIFSLLPTATQYARNAMFAGLTPLQISKLYPDLWTEEDELHSKNNHEEQLITTMLKRFRQNFKFYYTKTFNNKEGNKVNEKFNQISSNKLNIVVYNFVDMISHARTELPMMRELADDIVGYRAITKAWFEHSSLYDLLKMLSQTSYKVILTTDHGTTKVSSPIKITGEKQISTNLRYKTGQDLQFNEKDVFYISDPEKAQLPRAKVNSKYVFARNRDFFVYPNNYNSFVKYYKETFQHGGISLEEMLIPLVILKPKNQK